MIKQKNPDTIRDTVNMGGKHLHPFSIPFPIPFSHFPDKTKTDDSKREYGTGRYNSCSFSSLPASSLFNPRT
jgi:hypothetical protein